MLVERTDFPDWLVKNIHQEAEQIGFIFDEWLVTVGSILAFIIIAIRTCR
jgi:hypothetical protein